MSEGPLNGPDGTSVATEVTTDDDEWVLWSGGGADSDSDITRRQTRWLGLGGNPSRKCGVTSFRKDTHHLISILFSSRGYTLGAGCPHNCPHEIHKSK